MQADQLTPLLQAGARALRAAETEKRKGDTKLHVANLGAQADGLYYGKCGRIGALRRRGIELPIEANRALMFEAGVGNEDLVLKRLLASDWPGTIEHQHTLEWDEAGARVTGHPDVLFRNPDGTPAFVVELKLVSSFWTAEGVHYRLRPSSDHVVQTVRYASRLGNIPAYILYCSRVDFHLSTAPRWLQDKFAPGCHDVEFKDGKPFKLLPFERVYRLEKAADGHWYYQTHGIDQPVRTVLNDDALARGVQLVAQQGPDLGLAPRPTDQHVDGTKSYKACTYCEIAPVCDAYERNPAEWFDQAEALVETLKQED